jgi:hypothetical protein
MKGSPVRVRASASLYERVCGLPVNRFGAVCQVLCQVRDPFDVHGSIEDSRTAVCSPVPSHPTCVTLKGDSAETDAGGGPWRTRLLRLGSYPVTFGDRCDSIAMCLVTFLRTTLTPLTPLFVVTV